jgi:hypothetical protein
LLPVIVDISDSAVALTEPDDCRRFHVRVPPDLSVATLDAVLANADAGYRSGTDQVAVNISWLRSSAHDVPPDWADRFNKMLAFAGTKGWLTDDGAAVYGHITHD